ncbi:Uncharacterised protein [Actinobacillus pleuropneumoniae]|nr:Uncharacterised protein [Actinobacillus pleuropneumoniae]
MEVSDGWKLVISSTEPEEVVSQISLIFPATGSLSGGELAPAGGMPNSGWKGAFVTRWTAIGWKSAVADCSTRRLAFGKQLIRSASERCC